MKILARPFLYSNRRDNYHKLVAQAIQPEQLELFFIDVECDSDDKVIIFKQYNESCSYDDNYFLMKKTISLKPDNIDEFILFCWKNNIELYWKEELIKTIDVLDLMMPDEYSVYIENLLVTIEKGNEV